MAQKKIEAIVEGYLEPIVAQYEVELVEALYVKEGSNWYLRVFIDKGNGVTIDDCEKVSRALEKILDEKDPIENPYILEVSSPGIDRPIKKESDFIKYTGKLVDIKLYKALNGKKEYQGSLEGLFDNMVGIMDETGQKLLFTRQDIASIKLAVVF